MQAGVILGASCSLRLGIRLRLGPRLGLSLRLGLGHRLRLRLIIIRLRFRLACV